MAEEINLKEQMEKEAALLVQQEENASDVEVIANEPARPTLGRAQKFTDYETEDDILAAEIGWKNMPMESLLLQGMFYAAGTQVAIRAATV